MILKRLLPIVVLTALVFLIFSVSYDNPKLSVSFFDVGQGDSIFIEGPTGIQLLIDGGGNRSVLRELGKRSPFLDRSLDYVIATHPDQDHSGGLVDVIERYTVDVFIGSGVESNAPAYSALEKVLEEKNVTKIVASAIQTIDLGGGAYARILFPDRDVFGLESNTSSVVLQVVYGDTRFLLLGDAPKSIEKYLTTIYGSALQSDVLKLGHHGSKTSSAEEFIDAVSPMYAIVSAGKDNRFGHPHREVVDLIEEKSIRMFSTAEQGTITFISDGEMLSTDY